MKKKRIICMCFALLLTVNMSLLKVNADNNDGNLPAYAVSVENGQWKLNSANIYTYCDNSGNAVKGKFVNYNGKIYCLDSEGFLCIGTIYTKNEGNVYSTDSNGALVKNKWVCIDNKWMYFGNDYNCLKNKWIKQNGEWYYLKDDGVMAVNWQCIGGRWYYFNTSGVMLENTIVDNYRLGYDGAWIK